MPKRITNWHRAAKAIMAYREISFDDLAKATGMTRSYCSAIVNGRMYSDNASKRISDFLGIPDGDFTIQIKFIPNGG